MAGKKKGNDDSVGMSKTARASSLKKGGKQEGFIAAAPEHMDRIVSLGGGSHIYFLDPRNGKTLHLRVGSEAYNAAIISVLASSHAANVTAELTRKGFPIPVELVEES